jgi:outer membrane lipopolysaccharide assembly protein LptE/RlpB
MKTNKTRIHVKRKTNGFLSTVFGIITKIEYVQLKLHKEVTVTETACINKQREKTLLEAEIKKSQATELIRKLQNR